MKVRVRDDGICFPPMCVYCGRKAETTIWLSHTWGIVTPMAWATERMIVKVPACQAHEIAKVLWFIAWAVLVPAVALAPIIWWQYDSFEFAGWSGVGAIAGVVVLLNWFKIWAGRTFDALFSPVSIVEHNPRTRTIVLAFRDDALAEEVAELSDVASDPEDSGTEA
jgi:hypothetical protein